MGRKKKHPEIIEQLGQPLCNADGTPNQEFYPKKRHVGRPTKQEKADSEAMSQKEVWRQVPNLSPNCIVWVSNKGNVRLGAQATKEADGSVSIYIDGCKIPLDVLVYAAFQNPVKEPDWSNHILIHKNGNMNDNRFMNLDVMRVSSTTLNERHMPVITPSDVLNQYYPEFIRNSEMLRVYYEQKSKGLTAQNYNDHLTPNMVRRIENIAETVVSRMLAGFVMDGVRGDARFTSPFFRTSGSNCPPEFKNESGNSEDDEFNAGRPGSLDMIERYDNKTLTSRKSVDVNNPVEMLNEELRWQYRKIGALEYIWSKKSGELKSVKAVNMPDEWKQFGKVVQTVIVQKLKRRPIDKDYQIALRIFDSGEALFYMIPIRLWKRAERLLKKIVENPEAKLPDDIVIADIKENMNEDGTYSYSYIQKIKKERKDFQENRKSAADWFANAYNIGSSEGIMENTELKQDVIECNRNEMILILVEKLWNTETQILYDVNKLHMQVIKDQDDAIGINQKRIEKRKQTKIESERRALAKKGKIKVELLTAEEREMLLQRLREVSINKDAIMTAKLDRRKNRAIRVKAILPLKAGQVHPTILVFNSIKQASEELGVYEKQIRKCVAGEIGDVYGVQFEYLDMDDKMNAIWKYIKQYQEETEQIVAEEKKRIAKESAAYTGGFRDYPENIRPRGKKIVNGGLEGEEVVGRKVDLLGDYGLPGSPAVNQKTTIGDMLDAEKKKEEVRKQFEEKKRSVGVDGKEIYDDDDLDRLLDDD